MIQNSRYLELTKEVYGSPTTCKCPKCGNDWKTNLLWIGNGKPRKFCPACKTNIIARQVPEYETYAAGLNLNATR